MQHLNFIIILATLFIVELLYFKIANYYNIIDRPNHRSSHTIHTIRGGGIIFSVSALLFFFSTNFTYPYFSCGLALIALISFIDDIRPLSNKLRLLIHLVSVLLLLLQWNLFDLSFYWIFVSLVLVIGIVNAYNFMDGINGITAFYSLVTIFSLLYVNQYVLQYADRRLFVYVGFSIIVFMYFNFRTIAKCFAGDVGSVSIAFIIVFLLGIVILQTHNFIYINFLLIYGLDAGTTILFRLVRRENIFNPHRSHLYQYLANELKISHLYISISYGSIQLFINYVVLEYMLDSMILSLVFTASIALTFVSFRFILEGKKRLVNR
jgi:UDP-GlcNAc:undecaprenyl-phosphate GlcNAc-1-phosphate transferase